MSNRTHLLCARKFSAYITKYHLFMFIWASCTNRHTGCILFTIKALIFYYNFKIIFKRIYLLMSSLIIITQWMPRRADILHLAKILLCNWRIHKLALIAMIVKMVNTHNIFNTLYRIKRAVELNFKIRDFL